MQKIVVQQPPLPLSWFLESPVCTYVVQHQNLRMRKASTADAAEIPQQQVQLLLVAADVAVAHDGGL